MTQRLEHKFLREPMKAMNAVAGTAEEERYKKMMCDLFLLNETGEELVMKAKLTIGTRQSLLALWQSNHIAALLRKQYPECEVVLKKIVTKGDRILDVPLAQIGGKGLFTKEIEEDLLDGTIDLAVHSLKDMPTVLPEGLCLTAITERANVGDAFVSNKYGSFEELPLGAVVGPAACAARHNF